MNSLVTVVALVFDLCLFDASEWPAEWTLSKGPSDTSVLSGETVKLECFTTDKNYPPIWSYQKVGSRDKTDISSVSKPGDIIETGLMHGYRERHSIVENRTTGEYSLQITGANPKDAGSYTCAAKGGLGGSEKRSAELSVVEPYPVCVSNTTDALGENDCHKEPDTIEFSCKFRVYGNHLPKVTWSDGNHPEEAIIIDTPTKDATGMASSKLIKKGNHVGLDTTNFRCIIGSEGNAEDNRFACVTPKINVIKISHLTASKTLIAPEEVECAGWSKLNASGCKWFRRDEENDHQPETFVTSKPLLNLHKSEMIAGTYICVAECNIRGETCRVNLLNVSYKPPPSGEQSGNVATWLVAIVVVAIIVVAILIGLFFILRWRKNKKRGVSRTEMRVVVNASDHSSQSGSLAESSSSSSNGTSSRKDTPLLSESERARLAAEEEAAARLRANGQSKDFPDAKLGGPTKSERNRLAEERALAKMRSNVARRGGETNEAFSADTDVAEGVAANKTKHE